MTSFVKIQEDNVLSVCNGNSKGKTHSEGTLVSEKKIENLTFFLEIQQYIYHHEIEE